MIPPEAIEKAREGGYEVEIAFGLLKGADKPWRTMALDPAFWQALQKALKYDQPIWKCKQPLDRCDSTFCEYAGWKNLNPESQYSKVYDFLHLILTGGDTDAFWKELLN